MSLRNAADKSELFELSASWPTPKCANCDYMSKFTKKLIYT